MNSFCVLLLATLMVSAVNCIVDHVSLGHGIGGTILSKKDAASVEKVLETISSTIQQVYEGIEGRELSQAMKTIIAEVDELTAGQKVDEKAVKNLIQEVFEAMDSDTGSTTPFEGQFWSQREALSVAFPLLQELEKKTEELEKSGESVLPAMKAIAKTAQAIRVILNEIVSIVENDLKPGENFTISIVDNDLKQSKNRKGGSLIQKRDLTINISIRIG